MNKTIAILIFTFFLGCNAFAQASQSVLPTDTAAPVVTITQQQFDSLVSAAARGNQMELIAKQEAERMFDSYTTHTSLLLALFGVLITILVGLVGAVFPYMTNKAYKREMDAKIAAHDNSIQDIRDQMEQSEGKARESSKEAKAWALFSWARQLDTHDSEQLDRKIEIYTRAINEFTQFPEALFNRGAAYSDKGEYDKAIQDYDEAIKLNPQDADAYYNRGNAYCDKGEYDKAIQDYDEAIKLNPKYAEAYYNRGNAFFNKGEYDKAIQDYDKAIKLNPKYAEAYNNRGVAYMYRGKEGDYALAKADFEKGLTLNPDEEARQMLQRNQRKVDDLMKEKANKASAQ